MTETLPPPDHNRPSRAQAVRDDLIEIVMPLARRKLELMEAFERAPERVNDDETAGKLADFVKQITAASKATDAARVAAKEPHLEASRIVDGTFRPITDALEAMRNTLSMRLTDWQRRKAAEERRRREEAEREAREKAARAAEEAAAAARAAIKAEATIADAATAREIAAQANADAEQAHKVAAAKPADLSRTRGDYGAVASLTTFWDFADLDRETIDLLTLRPHLALAAIEQALRSFIKAGGRHIAGARIFENTKTRVR